MYRISIKFSHVFISILWVSVVFCRGVAFGADIPKQEVLLNVEEAQKFCLSTWFPRLRIGRVPTPDELTQFVDNLLKLYADDVELIDPNNKDIFGVEVLKGKDKVRQYYEAVLRNYPKWSFSILGIYPTEKGFILRYEGKDAPPVERFEGVDIIELRKEGASWVISKLFGYYDRKPFLRDE